ncbi:hypothetical protein BGX28_001138 [Mortierella sp. GBA30]|nr:hypothetical protein BGX28_001138 [Mortierella sp. GBA30]
MLPTEVWRLVLDNIPTVDLFSLYSTSRYMRALTASRLVQFLANKSVCLYIYQEYVRRIGIKFVFDHFDLARDRVVFRPDVTDNQCRFRSGLTLQNPQLEELAIMSSGSAFRLDQVQYANGRYFPARKNINNNNARKSSDASSMPPSALTPTSLIPPSASSFLETDPATATTITPVTSAAATVNLTETIMEKPLTASRKLTTDEKVYHGSKNFLDKTCPIHIRRSGIQQVDGSRYSFLQDYPWSLHYQVDNVQLPSSTYCSKRKKNNGEPNKRDRFFFDVRQDIYRDEGEDAEGSTAAENPQTHHYEQSKESMATDNGDNHPTILAKQNNTMGSGPRYIRALSFECSMNFLNPKRATRNIIGRWLEGKVQHWKRMLGGRKQATHSNRRPVSTTADSTLRRTTRGKKTNNHETRDPETPVSFITDDSRNGQYRNNNASAVRSRSFSEQEDIGHSVASILESSGSGSHHMQQAIMKEIGFNPTLVKAF